MGGSGSKNDDFSSNPNFNMERHRQVMQQLSGNYAPTDLRVPSSVPQSRPNIETTQFKRVERTCSIYKPSFNIKVASDELLLQLDYDSQDDSFLQIYVGVKDVAEDAASRITINVTSHLSFTAKLKPGKKVRFSNKYPLGGYKQAESSTMIVRIESALGGDSTEYSLRRVTNPNLHWKVLLEKLELQGTVTQLQNIYKSEQGNDCIICLCQEANTLIEPCNHLCICSSCSPTVRTSTNKCPICRSPITNLKIINQK